MIKAKHLARQVCDSNVLSIAKCGSTGITKCGSRSLAKWGNRSIAKCGSISIAKHGNRTDIIGRGIKTDTGRKKLVILGTGWASYKVLKAVDKKIYDVIVVSPRNHFLFTPLLCSTTVGTLEFR